MDAGQQCKACPAVRLSPREVDDLIQNALQNAKVTRLKQVREQSADFTKSIKADANRKKLREINVLKERLVQNAKVKLEHETMDLENEVLECLTEFGKAHSLAKQQVDPRIRLEAQRIKNERAARKRGSQAAEIQKNEQIKELKMRSRSTENRRKALEVEDVRSRYVVSRAPPPREVQSLPQPKNELPKVMYFDKKSLFQTDYVPKDVFVEEISSSKDAREAADREQEARELEEREKIAKKREIETKIEQRGKEALKKEKIHQKYLRLLEELDKMENQTKSRENAGNSQKWEIPSISTISQVSKENESQEESSETLMHCSEIFEDLEEIPVRDKTPEIQERSEKIVLPQPKPDCGMKLRELGQLFAELQSERQKLLDEERRFEVPVKLNSSEENSSTPSIVNHFVSEPQKILSKKTYKVGDAVRVDIEVIEKASEGEKTQREKVSMPESEKQKLAEILKAIRRERKVLEQMIPSKKIPSPGSQDLAAEATSTPVQKTRPETKREDLKFYVEKLLQMRREQIKELSVDSTKSISRASSRKSASPTASESSGRKTSVISQTSSSKFSSPLPRESSGFSESESTPREKGLTLQPLVEMYNDIYRAFNERANILKGQVSALREEKQQLACDMAEDSTFKTLTLSSGNETDRGTMLSSAFESLQISQTSTEASSRFVNLWKNVKDVSPSTNTSSGNENTTDLSSDISMPDVDAALRRLGLPSMQTVLRR